MHFSIVIPTYNRWTTLRQALHAVQAQTLPAREVIVIDDGSKDETPQALPQEFPTITYCRQLNAGPAHARNQGIELATSEFIAFTDDDCLPPPNWLASLADGFQRYPQAVGVGGSLLASFALRRTNLLAQYEEYCVRVLAQASELEILAGFDCPAGGTNNMSYRRSVLKEVGGFDPNFPYAAGEDADLKYRLARVGAQFLYTPIVVTHLQPYTWKAFCKQQFVRGKGSVYFDRKWRSTPSRLKIALRLLNGLFRLIAQWRNLPQQKFVLPMFIELWQNLRGQWVALGELS